MIYVKIFYCVFVYATEIKDGFLHILLLEQRSVFYVEAIFLYKYTV